MAETDNDLTYGFYSIGPRGKIKKMVKFQPAPEFGANVYNLMFGDYDEMTDLIDDRVVSNNGDQKAVLRSVAKAVEIFVNLYPQAIILIQGWSASRTRLYQMGIASAWQEIRERYEILGKYDNRWIPFKRGINYEAFIVYKKMA